MMKPYSLQSDRKQLARKAPALRAGCLDTSKQPPGAAGGGRAMP